MTDVYTEQVLEKAFLANLPPVAGCHRCGKSENPARTFTLAGRDQWLCRKCMLELDDAEALLAYVEAAMREYRRE